MYYYLVTFKRLANEHTPLRDLIAVYESIVKMINGRGAEWSSDYAVEVDKQYGRLHLHTILTTRSKPLFSKYQRKGWTIHFQEFPPDDLGNIVNYIHKDTQNKFEHEQREIESIARHEYMFID